MRIGNIMTFPVIDLPGKLIMRQAEGTAGTAAAVMLLHLYQRDAGNRGQDFSWLLCNPDTAHHMAGIMHRNRFVDRPHNVFAIAYLH